MTTGSEKAGTAELKRLDGFEIIDKLGEGGMGTVYRARQTSLNRLVALKVLPPQMASDTAYLESFRREAKAAARLHHPNIIRVYDAGEAGGLYYYAMEYIYGKTLFRWVQRDGKLPEQTVVEIGLCVAGALKHAWDKERLIHCDVKPENIMVDVDGNVKLCDLGLAKTFGEHAVKQTETDVFGTPQYMAPEQARGEKMLDYRSDIYSLGLVLYYALTAEVPFHDPSPAVVRARHLTGQLPDPRQFAPNMSYGLCLVLEKMLAKDVASRYQSWDDVLRDLELVLNKKRPQIDPLPEGKSTLRLDHSKARSLVTPRLASDAAMPGVKLRKRRLGWGFFAVIAVLLFAGALGTDFFLRQWRKPPPPPSTENQSQQPSAQQMPDRSWSVLFDPLGVEPLDQLLKGTGVVRNYERHAGAVTAVALSSDGRVAISGSMDKTLRVWDVAGGKELYVLQGHKAGVRCVALSLDKRYALSGSEDGIIKLWDPASARELKSFQAHVGPALSVVISPDGKRVLSGGADGKLRLWSLPDCRELLTFAGHTDWVYSVSFSPDGKHALSGSNDMTAKIWEVETGREVYTLRQGFSVYAAAFSPNGRSLLCGGYGGRLRLWETATGREVHEFRKPPLVLRTVRAVVFTPDGRQIICGTDGGGLVLWDVASGQPRQILRPHMGAIRALVMSADGHFMLSAGDDRKLLLWKL